MAPHKQSIRLEIDGARATIKLARPDRSNALDREMVQQIEAALDQVEAMSEVRSVTVTGEGDVFCAGWSFDDIAALAQGSDDELTGAFENNERILQKLENFGRPTIALINGPVAGFGVSLAARCDFAVAVSTATFHLPEAALGLVPASVARDMIAVMGRRAAFDWLALADRRSAAEAQSAGLIRSVVEAADLARAGCLIADRLEKIRGDTLEQLKNLLTKMDAAGDEGARQIGIHEAVRAVRSPHARALIASARGHKNKL